MDISSYKVGVIVSLEECGTSKGGKALKACKVNIGDADKPITVVTNATNVRGGSRVAIAPAGTSVLDEDGEERQLKITTVGGVLSEGMFCDSRMLGWSGGAAGLAVQIPDSFEIGSAPPASKPRGKGSEGLGEEASPPEAPGLFEKKLTKEEKKKLAAEKRAAKKAAKEAKPAS